MKKLFPRLNQLQIASANRAASFTINLGYSDSLFYSFSEKKNIVEASSLRSKEYTKTPFIIQILFMLKREGYIRYFTIETKGRSIFVTVFLKYTSQGTPGIRSISNISTPGRMLYVSINSLWQPLSTSGIYIINSPLGLISDREARKISVGGQMIFGIS